MEFTVEDWPDFCFDGNRVCFPTMIKNLKRYQYIKEVPGGYDLHSSLRDDHPKLFEFLVGYMISQTANQVASAIDNNKVEVLFDEKGNRFYEFEEDAFEVD